jgi:hypothetical protein
MLNQPDLVLIEWVDGSQPIPGWQWLEDIESRKPHRCVSVGFLIHDDAQTKILAPNLGASNGDEHFDQVSGLMAIPTAAVVRLVRLTDSFSAASSARDAA